MHGLNNVVVREHVVIVGRIECHEAGCPVDTTCSNAVVAFCANNACDVASMGACDLCLALTYISVGTPSP